MLGSIAFSGPACIIITYLNKSAHMTIPLIKKKKENLLIFFFFLVDLYFFSVLEFYFAIFLPTMTTNPRLYEK